MSVPLGTARIQYLGAGSPGPFAFNFTLYQSDHIKVVKTDALGADTTLALTTDYLVSVATDFASATVLLVVPLAIGEKLTLTRDPPISQLVEWRRNDAFPHLTHQRAADLAVMLIDRLNEKIGRSLLLPESSAFSGLVLPNPSAEQFLRWNQAGTALENLSIAGQGNLAVSAYIETLLDDSSPAQARATLGAGIGDGAPGGYGARVNIASAATVDLGTAVSHFVMATGSVTITSFGSSASLAAPIYNVRFDSPIQITASANIFTPTGGNLTLGAGESVIAEYRGAGVWVILAHNKNANIVAAGKQTMWIPAVAMYKNDIQANPVLGKFGVSSFLGAYLTYTAAGLEDANFLVAMPKNWDRGPITCQVYWFHPTTVGGNVLWQVFASGYGDGDLIDGVTFGNSATSMIDTAVTANVLRISPESTPFQPGNTLAANDMVHFIMRRNGPDALDTLATQCFLLGLQVFYTTTANTDI